MNNEAAIQEFRRAVYHELMTRTALWDAIATKGLKRKRRHKQKWDAWAAASVDVRRTAPPVLDLLAKKQLDATVIFRLLRAVEPAPHDNPDKLAIPSLLDNLELHLGRTTDEVVRQIPLRTIDSVSNHIVMFLRKSPAAQTITAIARKTLFDRKTVRNRLLNLCDSGRVVKLDNGRFTATKPTKIFA